MTKKKINPALYKRLLKLNDSKVALDAFMKTIMAEGQRMMQEFGVEQRQIWIEIQKETGVDLNTQEWAPSAQEPDTIVLIQQRFLPPQ